MSNWPYPRIVAHRGGGKLAPENTLAAIDVGAKYGHKMIEFDAKLSKDGEIFLLHDDNLERTSNGWGVAGDRALSARRVLEEAGMPEDKVMQVSAMADQMLLDSKNPQSAGNRRIEIMVLTKSASDTLYQYFGQHGDKVVQPLVQKLDKQQVLSQRTR